MFSGEKAQDDDDDDVDDDDVEGTTPRVGKQETSAVGVGVDDDVMEVKDDEE